MHVGDRQGHPFLAGTLIWRRSAKGSLKPTLSRATTSQLMPTTRNNERLAELTADLALRRVAVSPGALGKWLVKSALSLGDFRSHRDNSTMQYLRGIGFRADNDRVHPDLVFSLPVIPHQHTERRHRTVVSGSSPNFYTLMILRNDKASVRRYGYSGDRLQ
jgi:hypothetical protein